jgi:putative spermidine/putrescine transport system ATP-binding protein/putrescine transport system ATP-binding protein
LKITKLIVGLSLRLEADLVDKRNQKMRAPDVFGHNSSDHTPTLTVRNVTKRFGRVTAVDNASFEVPEGKTIAILGPSGCGKTTILKVVAGFEQPDEGHVFISGTNMRGKRPYERNVGLVFQDYALFPHMTVYQNIAYGLKKRGFERKEIPGRVQEMLKLVNLSGYENRWPMKLSGGQQQRVALARALVVEPEIMLLDEPMSALDAKLRQELRIALKELLRTLKSTTILVTHDQYEAMSLADQVIVMSAGRIIQAGTPFEVYHEPKSRFVAGFVGRSNWFDGELGSKLENSVSLFHTRGGDLYVKTPSEQSARYDVCVRPERMIIHFGELDCPNERNIANRLRGHIVHFEQLGGTIEFLVELESGLRVSVTHHQIIPQPDNLIGASVTVTFLAADCLCIPI